MSRCSAKNRECAGGKKWCVGGSLVLESGSKLIFEEGVEIPPFWIEEKRTLVAEGVFDGAYPVELQLIAGKEYTIVVDGVKYVGECQEESAERYIRYENGDTIIHIDEKFVTLYEPTFKRGEYHKVEFVEEVYHTIHDFMVMVDNKEEDFNLVTDIKVVAGDFAAAKEKILKGLPATVYLCYSYESTSDNIREKSNQSCALGYRVNADGEYLTCSDVAEFYINPDGTAVG